MKKTQLFYSALFICGILSACQHSDKNTAGFKDSSTLTKRGDSAAAHNDSLPNPTNLTNESKVDDAGAAFIKEAGVGGMMEVDLGKLAAEKSNNEKVKSFAAKMVTDHTKANDELKAIAEKLHIVVPADYPADQKAHMDAMKKLNGAEFDQHYIDMMVNDHDKTIALFKKATTLRAVELKDFAAKTLPTLEEHYKLAKAVKTGVNNKAISNKELPAN